MNSYFRVNPDGSVAGISDSDEATAKMNLAEGQYLRPFDPAVDVTQDRWDGKAWVRAGARSRPEDDPDFMRRSGYPDLREQVGALMKVVPALLSGDPVSAADRAEFDAIVTRILGVKAEHPKTATNADPAL